MTHESWRRIRSMVLATTVIFCFAGIAMAVDPGPGVGAPGAGARHPGINQPGAAGNTGVGAPGVGVFDPGLNQPGVAGNVGGVARRSVRR